MYLFRRKNTPSAFVKKKTDIAFSSALLLFKIFLFKDETTLQ